MIMLYSEKDIVRIAKRYKNNKRSYLIVNPFQAKHIPVKPKISIEMMQSLGTKLQEKYSTTHLVVGFAETATAIGSVVASCFDDCTYIQTTREILSDKCKCIFFEEEHSHAVEQKLCSDRLEEFLSATDTVLFVDDEISTGKTLINIVEKFARSFPQIKKKRIVAASIVNRVSLENLSLLGANNIICEALLNLDNKDYSEVANSFDAYAPSILSMSDIKGVRTDIMTADFLNPRVGVFFTQYNQSCISMSSLFISKDTTMEWDTKKILVLGTEECMYPALILSEELEKRYSNADIFCHATTRSPIAVLEHEDYPIKNGYQIHSFYDDERITYIYNIQQYDKVVVVSDTHSKIDESFKDVISVFSSYGCDDFYLIRGAANV